MFLFSRVRKSTGKSAACSVLDRLQHFGKHSSAIKSATRTLFFFYSGSSFLCCIRLKQNKTKKKTPDLRSTFCKRVKKSFSLSPQDNSAWHWLTLLLSGNHKENMFWFELISRSLPHSLSQNWRIHSVNVQNYISKSFWTYFILTWKTTWTPFNLCLQNSGIYNP